MQVSLVMVEATGASRELPVAHLPVVIGRDEGCKLRIPFASVSRKHCELTDRDDELLVRDLGSSNGTYVNGERVKERELMPGDLLSVGPVVFVVRIDGHPKEIDAADSYAAGSVAVGGPSGAGDGIGGAAEAISGVPTWSGGRGGGTDKAAPAAPKTAPAAGASESGAKKDSDDSDIDLDDLLAGLDLGDDEDDEK